MGCLLALLAAFAPRMTIIILWLFTNVIDRAYEGFFLPFLGMLVLPYTTLFYALAYAPVAGVEGWGWFFVVLGFLLDAGNWVGGGVVGRQRYATA